MSDMPDYPPPNFVAFLAEPSPLDGLPEPDNLATLPCFMCEVSQDDDCDLCGGTRELTELRMSDLELI